jgi:glycosyltransferase EpsF
MNTLSIFALYAAKRVGVPVRIAHSHSTAGRGEFARNILKYTLRPFSRLYPTHLFACSEYAGRWLFGNRAFCKGKVVVVRNAIDTKKFKFNPNVRERVRRELGVEGKFVVGHVGRFMPQKNHAFLLDIFAEVHRRSGESVLLLVGDGELKTTIEEKARRLALTNCVIFLNVRDDVNELYQAMDVFVLPSLYEGLAVVRVEAVAAGLPCLVAAGQTTELEVEDINCKYIGIKKKDLNAWNDAVLSCRCMPRVGGSERLQMHGYDITKEAEQLCGEYLRIGGIL